DDTHERPVAATNLRLGDDHIAGIPRVNGHNRSEIANGRRACCRGKHQCDRHRAHHGYSFLMPILSNNESSSVGLLRSASALPTHAGVIITESSSKVPVSS